MRVGGSLLRRYAGGEQREKLASALVGWTREEIDSACDESGKTPLMVAAWRGNIDNVRLLLDIGCDINKVATGQYCYGKSAIFFAITRCRDDVVDLCIERGARLTIVNNKGQSPRSLAVSHLSAETLRRVIDHEHGEWTNYRETHSDGFAYGDLDKRFAEDSSNASEDIVVRDVCVNPSTKTSRRGNFERNNPHVVRKTKEKKNVPQKKTRFEAGEIAAMGRPEELSRILVARDFERSWNWVPEAAFALFNLVPKEVLLARLDELDLSRQRRESVLVRRALSHHRDDDLPDLKQSKVENTCNSPPPLTLPDDLNEQISMLGGPCPTDDSGVAILCDPPLWISSSDDLPTALPPVVYFDAEFDDRGNLATLQLAWILGEPKRAPTSVVIDAPALTRAFLVGLLSTKHLVGFAINQDLKALRAASDRCNSRPPAPLPNIFHITDLQAIAVRHRIQNSTRHSVPALAALVRKCLGITLEKKYQQADWGNLPRPLAPCYMNYAALDAAILPFLLKGYVAAV